MDSFLEFRGKEGWANVRGIPGIRVSPCIHNLVFKGLEVAGGATFSGK